jgi:predicted lipid carrier protein YhbT
VATAEQCEEALYTLAARLAESGTSRADFDRTLSCTVRDLGIIFAGHLAGGRLHDITRTTKPDAQVRLDVTGDDLLKLVDGSLNVGAAWASGRLKIGAGVRDLIRLRSIF